MCLFLFKLFIIHELLSTECNSSYELQILTKIKTDLKRKIAAPKLIYVLHFHACLFLCIKNSLSFFLSLKTLQFEVMLIFLVKITTV